MSIFKLNMEDGFGVVTFDVPDARMNTWTDPAIESFFDVIDELTDLDNNGKLKAVTFISGKEGSFITGADLNTLASKETRLEFMKDIEIFQIAFNRLAKIEAPKIAAISGFCLGGGLEMALACDYRIAMSDRRTMIGLTETSVGLFPAGGGTQRLTRLIGYPAIECILSGRMMSADEALELGIVDKVVDGPYADFLPKAEKFMHDIEDETIKIEREEIDFSDVDKVTEEIREKYVKRNRGRELPAVKYAIETIREGVKMSLEDGLELEKKNFITVAMAPESKGAINSFFLKTMSDKPQRMITEGFEPMKINKTAVIGFGSMGRGIVINLLRDLKKPVVVKDTAEALEAGQEFVHKMLTRMYERKRLRDDPEELMELIIPITEYDANELGDVDIVLEAVFEELNVKYEVYEALEKVLRDDTVIASNTSFLSINELAKGLSKPERFAGMHFFGPVWIMQMVEIIAGDQTTDATKDNLINLAGLMRKRPVVCKDNEGFVVNAVLDPFMSDSLMFLEQGNDPNEIEAAFIEFGMPMGPIRLNDEVGLDVSHSINQNRGIEQKTLENLFNAGFYGLKKNGKGLYKQDGTIDEEAMKQVHKRDLVEYTKQEMSDYVLEHMVTIGKDLLDRGIVDDVRMIDIGILWGAGYPTDKGGPMKWADLIGMSEELFGEKFYK